MRTIGIIGAMEIEVTELKNRMQIQNITSIASMDFCQGSYYGKNVVIVRSGIGKVNAAICAQILIDRFQADIIINTGIAGSLQADIDIGDIVISCDTLEHDMDATNFGYPLGTSPQMENSIFKADDQLIALAKTSCTTVNPDIHTHIGRIVSGDHFISDHKKKDFLKENFKAMCTEMEGAAIAHTASLNHIPFVIIRAISDKADGSAHMDYPEFEAKAALHSFNLIDSMLQNLHI